jgi:subtilase family serine protease
MQLSNDNMNWTTPEAYATTKAWTLSSGGGSKTVFARFKDNAGNWSTTVGDSILLSTAKADLRISSLIVPETGTAGRSITVTDTTWNAGPGTATASTTRFYLSKDPSLSARDVLLGSRSVQPLSAGGTATGTTALTIPRATEEGNYYILAVSDGDNAVSEVNESNNIRYRSIRIRD